jgi:hypothetical protein
MSQDTSYRQLDISIGEVEWRNFRQGGFPVNFWDRRGNQLPYGIKARLANFLPSQPLPEDATRPVTRRSVGYRERADELDALRIHETGRNIANKISRGGFTAVFVVRCLFAIGCYTLRLESD